MEELFLLLEMPTSRRLFVPRVLQHARGAGQKGIHTALSMVPSLSKLPLYIYLFS